MEEKESFVKDYLKEFFIERTYTVKEFFYDDSFKDYIRKTFRLTTERHIPNYDFASLYPYHHQPIIMDHLSMIQSVGRIERSSNTENTILQIEKNRYYDRNKAIEIQNQASEMLKRMTEYMKENNISYVITAEQRSKS